MTNLEMTILAANKAIEEIARIEAENAAMKNDIDDVYEMKLKAFKDSLMPMMDVFINDKIVYTHDSEIILGTGIDFGEVELEVSLQKDRSIYLKVEGGSTYVFLSNIKTIKRNCNLYQRWVKKLLDNSEVAAKNIEKDFIENYQDLIDEKFINVAKENERIRKEWKEVCVSEKPFYREEWTDNDIIDALTEAGKPLTKANIDEIKAKFLFNMSMEGVGIRRELLFDYAKEVG